MRSVDKLNVLVVGMASSGREAVKLLHEKGAIITITDTKQASEIEGYDEISHLISNELLGSQAIDVKAYDLLVLSPGVPTKLDFIVKAKELGIPVWAEVELAFRFAKGKFIGITGTNGKTTTTTIVGEIFKAAGFKTSVVGNIGRPISEAVRLEDDVDRIYVTELSSYQLESVHEFKPWIAALLNITPDHLARHGTMEEYVTAKLSLVRHMEDADHFIMNADDPVIQKLMHQFPEARLFSRERKDVDTYVVDDAIVTCSESGCEEVIRTDEIFIKGSHNVENALAVIAICDLAGIDAAVMAAVLKEFKGVEHRNEFVAEVNGIRYFNDSKATNPEASIPAIKSMDRPTILIAGGMDKGSDYSGWISYFQNVRHVVLFGETKNDIKEALIRSGFTEVSVVDTLEAAVQAASGIATSGDAVLLSPACASWDMYKNFEVRGDEFKQFVYALQKER
ncbi:MULTISPECIES: UDP-N-acetylmuramoyl-L-alanine--D-glutamate ligase [unclassified Fusibacter]|uniref:UDP-N-acetylmuramoyl-L-alanine--D-glutamate ligase n=1 Tax=unclassified Fusibacter TaxID=2624464 RepID=UPI00101101F3|nr:MULTISPECIES: UDP-N-acetylmuramoyl-L-alanine--D-glutamate ligase [unclassified Fusibacter]MCK8061319.1 UDP-N-acetylmuramoyl-L-alanine--D-glutamate ligase [Fusibacter sp. A2]NPE23484.1 UDP-N-acetylmuramoyl-L-alanine--D-glutamate ligase [Fusibacter sp. A1]RXV59090.1 UDP-N-acetylmuramoyl-L-alanine--D-glutamate ligase [Fusibacter sp. A1]